MKSTLPNLTLLAAASLAFASLAPAQNNPNSAFKPAPEKTSAAGNKSPGTELSAPSLTSQPVSANDPFIVKEPGSGGAKPSTIADANAVPRFSNIILQVEYYSLPRVQARQWQGKFDTAELYKAVAEAGDAEKQDVKLENFVILRCRSGQRMRVESIAEFPYPTEFDPPQIPQTYSDFAAKAVAEAVKERAQSATPSNIPPWPNTPATPTAFTMRNLGSSIEVESVVSDNQRMVDVNIAPELIAFDNWEWMDGAQTVAQPKFSTQKLTTAITMRMGAPSFLGTMSNAPHKKNGEPVNNRVFLVFITPSMR